MKLEARSQDEAGDFCRGRAVGHGSKYERRATLLGKHDIVTRHYRTAGQREDGVNPKPLAAKVQPLSYTIPLPLREANGYCHGTPHC